MAAILAVDGGVIARRQHPELASTLDWLVRQGRLLPLLPGVYCAPQSASDARTRIRAVPVWSPDAVLLGSAAAAVSFWPAVRVGAVEVSAPTRRAAAEGYQLNQRRIPPDLIEERRGLRFTTPALTALDLCATMGGDGIDTLLRSRAATLEQLHLALSLTKTRRGNARRRELILDSRDQPWSAAERRCHQLLPEAGITGWRSNLAVPGPASVYYIDVAFEQAMLALEIDGRLHETDREIFETDRWRQNHLVLQGWRVLRYTWAMLQQHPEVVVEDVNRALALRIDFPTRRRSRR